MAQTFLIGMEHDAWHPPEAIKRPLVKRPLGRLESDRYTPRQPVISCHTLNIDQSGSRTYRACSTSAILEEQHRLLHTIYANRRKANTAQQGNKSRPSSSALDQGRRRFLTVNGTSRPWTSVERQPPTWSGPPRARPKTTGSHRLKRRRPREDRGRQQGAGPDPGSLAASTAALRRVNQQVQSQWETGNHCLDDSALVRGHGDHSDPTPAGQWVSFGGGDGRGSGVVEAFTSAMKGRGEYYTVDGTVGSRVANQMRHGDKIRVGINGHLQSTNLRVKTWPRHKHEHEEDSVREEESDEKEESIVPLCWTDQVTQADAKVLQARLPSQSTPETSLCDTTPVTFETVIPAHVASGGRTNTWYREGSTPSRLEAGFAVRARIRPRLGPDGTEGTSRGQITSLTIDHPQSDHGDQDLDRISLEDLLEKNFTSKNRHPNDKKRAEVGISNLSELMCGRGNSPTGSVHTPPTGVRSPGCHVGSPPSGVPAQSGNRAVRPVATSSGWAGGQASPGPGGTDRPGRPLAHSPGPGGTDRPGRPLAHSPGPGGTDRPGRPLAHSPGPGGTDRPGRPLTHSPGPGGTDRPGRPLTAHSASSLDRNIESFIVTSSTSGTRTSGSAKSGQGRATPGCRPPPARPCLHKSAAAQGASIGGRGAGKGDPSYIQITQPLSVPREVMVPALQLTVSPHHGGSVHLPYGPVNSTTISSAAGPHPLDQYLNPEEFPELELTLEENGEKENEEEVGDRGDEVPPPTPADPDRPWSPPHPWTDSVVPLSDTTPRGDVTYNTTTPRDDVTYTTTPSGDVTYTTTPRGDVTYTTTPRGDVTYATTPRGDVTYTTTPSGDVTYTTTPRGDVTYTTPRGDVTYAFNIPTAGELVDEDSGADRTRLHDRLVEQTASLLAGAIIGADLPADLTATPSGGVRSSYTSKPTTRGGAEPGVKERKCNIERKGITNT